MARYAENENALELQMGRQSKEYLKISEFNVFDHFTIADSIYDRENPTNDRRYSKDMHGTSNFTFY